MTNPVALACGAAPVAQLVEAFERDPAAAGQQLRRLLRAEPEAFRNGALPALKSPSGGRGYRFLVTQLVLNGMLIDCLASDWLTAAEAAELARVSARLEPELDILLAQRVAEEAVRPSGRYDDSSLARLLGVLESIAGGLRAVSFLNPLLGHANPRIRSKAALLVGRASRNAGLAAKQLCSADARVRANAIEALWRTDGQNCREVFRNAARDPNCRVAGNAALGLYLLGDALGVRELMGMAGHPSPHFRATAAWCMGATEDPRFLAPLEQLIASGGGKVRHNALRSIARVRQNGMRIKDAGRLRVDVAGTPPADGAPRVRVAVAAEGILDLPGLAATCFVVREGGETVWDYDVEELPPPETMVAGFAVPEGLAADVIGDCLPFRRPGDKWAAVKYAERADEARESAAPGEAPRFAADMTVLRAALAVPDRAAKSMIEAAAELLNVAVLARGGRNLVLLAGPQAREEGRTSELARAARAAKTPIHIVALPGCGNAALEALATSTGGRYFQPDRSDGIADSMQRLCLGMLNRYEVSWAPRAGAAEAGIEVWCGRGFGEGVWRAGC